MREMLTYLPEDFGAFRLDLDLEAALSLGFDPVFGAGDPGWRFEGLEFRPDMRGFGQNTRLVMRTSSALPAGEMLAKLPAFRGMRGVEVVSEAELSHPTTLQSLESLRVERGQRRVISRRYDTMTEALAALPMAALEQGIGQIEFFAVNHPAEGVHVLLGTFDTPADLEFALGAANGGATGDFISVTNKGKRGGFHGA
jgi:hypothetical protein